ncbi:unnamed protein product [Acanthoscelides obtectus]|uniref:Uncharacterized protein n=1 Tax=Acanthoscelides obtectus TaxID=200917 RepID=A0A9P0PLI8_ACAOB|nr:unnamed protein product [Acanthoscelides obtectus]CAK1624660.1 hypothetical protein AOBTE_LOCUS2679 [Acanthoscelides obtectus]
MSIISASVSELNTDTKKILKLYIFKDSSLNRYTESCKAWRSFQFDIIFSTSTIFSNLLSNWCTEFFLFNTVFVLEDAFKNAITSFSIPTHVLLSFLSFFFQ